MRPRRAGAAALAACLATAAGCAGGLTAEADTAIQLVGTNWQLVEFRSDDDDVGIIHPPDPTLYTLTLEVDGRVSMRLDCNRGTGTWTAEGDERGEFTFGPLGVTKVYCGPTSLDQHIARDTELVRTYVLRERRLYLDLTDDGGTYVWELAEPSR